MPLCRFTLLLTLALLAGAARAADHPAAGDKLLLKDNADPTRRKVKFKAARDLALDPAAAPAPTSVGASLAVFGSGAGDGATGTLTLVPGLWTGLGNPPGAKGYRYLDATRAVGVRKVVFKGGPAGGTLVVSGGGSSWPYVVTQAQTAPVTVSFTVGGEVYCAAFDQDEFLENGAGKFRGALADAPIGCASPPTTTTTTTTTTTSTTSTTAPGSCGNGIAQVPEECDDGNTNGDDGCDALCQLEDTSALCDGVPSTSGTALDSVRVASGLFQPTHIAAPPLDPRRVYVTQQNGIVRIIKDGALAGTFLDISDEVSCCGEQGLLGIAFHPDFETNGRFFVSYTAPSDGPTGCGPRGAGDNVIAEYRIVTGNPDLADESTRVELFRLDQPFTNHNGGLIAFGPGGFLYFGVGDGGLSGDSCEAAQSDTDPLGKLYRIDVDNPPANPLDAVWAKGVRNPWRWSFDRATADLYVADVGQGSFEEVDLVSAPVASGLNYGWDVFEGRQCFEPMVGCSLPGAVVPVLEYCHAATVHAACGSHPRGCSITGGFVYRGCALPDLRGKYFYSDFCAAFVRSFQGVSGGNAQNLVDHTADVSPSLGGFNISSVTSFGEDARGELYIADQGGEVFKLVPGS